MCGIIGIVGNAPVADRLIDSLRRLEYRGYDSAGIATLDETGHLDRRRAVGKLKALEAVVADHPLPGLTGIGHTRWATHGAPTEANAHPHMTDRVALVHNGIIENFRSLRDELKDAGITCEGESDTEVITRLYTRLLEADPDPISAFHTLLDRLEGAFALAVVVHGAQDLLLGARRGSPLVVGVGEGEHYLGSDALALATLTNRLIYLEEGDRVVLSRDSATITDAHGKAMERPVTLSHVSGALVDKGNHRHFMQKEIYEQPTAVAQTLGRYLDHNKGAVVMPGLDVDAAALPQVTLIACGTSYYAALTAQYWLERLARIPVRVDIASEFRYRHPVFTEGGLAIFISQSGETADTLAAMRHAKQAGQTTAAIVNVPESSMAREADVVLPTHAGPEIGVASTKSFTCQLAVLAALSVWLGHRRGHLDAAMQADHVDALGETPNKISRALAAAKAIEAIAVKIAHARDILFVGRGIHYPMALEGALKLKELSYIHAEGYAAGELKHGPIALIDEDVPVIGIAPRDRLQDKTVSNLQEIIARHGRVIVFTDDTKALGMEGLTAALDLPEAGELTAPLIYAIPIQLLAYHTAVEKGTDVDQPRNLAKSVTVE
ncbi:glutamine--fructose-6-phosphate transaminase (isomerizing) [Yunchengibacter salinarum]|uniref:glutamine--fructose-6-phosphate transaminase (isomerizing) n=1 Tax=Yunchengibacter salinarum TaxID=3133399 RepID=UPI0035B649BB